VNSVSSTNEEPGVSPLLDGLPKLASERSMREFLAAALHQLIQAMDAQGGSLLLVRDTVSRVREGELPPAALRQISVWEEGLEDRLPGTEWRPTEEERLPISTRTLGDDGSLLANGPLLMAGVATGSLSLVLPSEDAFPLARQRELTSWLRTIGSLAEIIEQLTITRRSLDQLTFLHETSQALTSTLDLQQVLDNTMELATSILDAQAATLMLIDQETNELVFDIPYGEKRELLHSYRMPMGEGIAGWVATHGEPAIVNRVAVDERFSRDADVRTGFLTKSVICVPLQIKDRTIGVLEALNKSSSEGFIDDDLRLLSTLAAQASIAIENARLYRSLRQERDKIVRIQEEARRALARDLHDTTLQRLSSISMAVEHVRQLLEREPAGAGRELDRIQQLVARASREARVLLFELRPLALETDGLAAALRTYIDQLQTGSAPHFHFEDGGFNKRLPADVEGTAFAITQEAISNARKHAAADNIWIRLTLTEADLRITVEDDGQGFDPGAARENSNREAHFGLLNMQERAQLIDADLEITSTPGQGGRIALSIPLFESEGKGIVR
jgi:signal transduction histidine kinase